jgi:hypothetical protein
MYFNDTEINCNVSVKLNRNVQNFGRIFDKIFVLIAENYLICFLKIFQP